MENEIEVMKKMLDLTVSCEEAIHHLAHLLESVTMEETQFLMVDLLKAYQQIEYSIHNFRLENNLDDCKSRLSTVIESLDRLVSTYEGNDHEQAINIIQENLLLGHQEFHRQLQLEFNAFIIT